MSDIGEQVRASILKAIESFNADDDQRIPTASETVLLGQGGVVDSLGLVRFILLVERQVEDDLGVAISLTDEKAMSQRNSPFRTLQTLAEYVASCVNGAA